MKNMTYNTVTAQFPSLCTLVVVVLMSLGILVVPQTLSAQTCGSDYAIQRGDSLGRIAERVYGSASKWTIIFYANQDRLGPNASLLVPGLSVRIPCIGEKQGEQALPPAATTTAKSPQADSPFLQSSMVRKIEILTADGMAPFTGRSLREGGMITHLLSSALNLVKSNSQSKFGYGISWVNDWSAHLNPLLSTRAFDAGYPWTRPQCDQFDALDFDAKFRCQRFLFSDPLFEVLTHVFVRKDSPIKSISDEDISGKSICRPNGHETNELNEQGRNWVKDGKIVLIRAQTVDECFQLLDKGSLDAVAVSKIVGQASAAATGLADRIRVIDKPIAIRTLHVVVSKTHPSARTILYYINSSLSNLKESGEFDNIVTQHLQGGWKQEPVTSPAVTTAPADEKEGAETEEKTTDQAKKN